MPDHPHPEKLSAALPSKTGNEAVLPAAGDVSISAANSDPVGLGAPKPVEELTPEEQMALFEKELKEKDWGHQPC